MLLHFIYFNGSYLRFNTGFNTLSVRLCTKIGLDNFITLVLTVDFTRLDYLVGNLLGEYTSYNTGLIWAGR